MNFSKFPYETSVAKCVIGKVAASNSVNSKENFCGGENFLQSCRKQLDNNGIQYKRWR